MKIWNQVPLVRILLSFVAGMLCGFHYSCPVLFLFSAGVFCLLDIIVFSGILNSKEVYAYRWIFGFAIHIALFCAGWLLTSLNSEINYANHFSKLQQGVGLVGIVNEDPKEKGKNFRFEVKVISVCKDQHLIRVEGLCLAYVRVDSLLKAPVYGDLIAIRKWPGDVPPSPNPGQFDFKKWLLDRQISQQVFLTNADWKLLAPGFGNPVVDFAVSCRRKLLAVLRAAGLGGQEYAVLSALILGYEDEILPETMQAYAAAGALHILSVSGMHVGLIYGVIIILLKFMDRIKHGKIIRAVLILLFLWFYALLTGFSASVLRSAMMLSFVVIAKTMALSSNMYNTLAASALALFALFSPFLVCQVGFQLSYCAVAGIVFLYKPIYNNFYFAKWLPNQIWTILAVSLAAQLTTFPLSLFYFHQFPNYFLFANLLVIPLSSLVIFSGLALFPLIPFSWLLSKFGYCVSFAVACLNGSVQLVEKLPYALSQDLFVSFSEMILLYGALICASLFFIIRSGKYFFYFLVFMVAFLSSKINLMNTRSQQSECIIYDIPGHSCMELIRGKNAVFLLDKELEKNPRTLKSATDGYRILKGISPDACSSFILDSADDIPFNNGEFSYSKGLIHFGRFSVLSVDPAFLCPDHLTGMHFNLIYIHGNPKIDLEKLVQNVSFDLLIADASNSPYKIQKWKEVAGNKGIRFYDVSRDGAYIFNSSP